MDRHGWLGRAVRLFGTVPVSGVSVVPDMNTLAVIVGAFMLFAGIGPALIMGAPL